ncbi:TnpV protein [Enterococcus sp. RIT-PI-f]|uniref:TnpV protein n=1 Tax=Enterococcus sp. RIT-PI-f TaxID=1690244 RepID=UPI0035634BE7
MKLTYQENQNGQLIPQMEYPENQPLGRFGSIAVEKLKEEQPTEYQMKLMQGELMTYGHTIDKKVWERVATLAEQMEQQNPLTLEEQQNLETATKIRNNYREQAIEIAMSEIL